MTYTNESRMEFRRRLRDDWRDLAIYFKIETATFERGYEADRIWSWLECRNDLAKLPAGLVEIGRGDLAEVLVRETTPAQEPTPHREHAAVPQRLSPGTWKAGVAGVVAVGVLVTLSVVQPWDTDETIAVTPTGSAEPSANHTPEVYTAVVRDTWDVGTGRFVGVKSYRDPGVDGRGAEAGHYPEGATVFVRCRRGDGREISDAPWGDRPLSTTGWFLLTSPSPEWLPDMYVGLQATVPACAEG